MPGCSVRSRLLRTTAPDKEVLLGRPIAGILPKQRSISSRMYSAAKESRRTLPSAIDRPRCQSVHRLLRRSRRTDVSVPSTNHSIIAQPFERHQLLPFSRQPATGAASYRKASQTTSFPCRFSLPPSSIVHLQLDWAALIGLTTRDGEGESSESRTDAESTSRTAAPRNAFWSICMAREL